MRCLKENPVEDYLYKNEEIRQNPLEICKGVAFTLLDYYMFLCIDFSVDDSLC